MSDFLNSGALAYFAIIPQDKLIQAAAESMRWFKTGDTNHPALSEICKEVNLLQYKDTSLVRHLDIVAVNALVNMELARRTVESDKQQRENAKEFEVIQTGLVQPEGKNCVFLWLYCLDGTPYEKHLIPGDPNLKKPMFLALMRWDGSFGTVGGKVDAGESLTEALIREVKEEISFELTDAHQPVPLISFQAKTGWHIHSYSLELNYKELRAIQSNAMSEENFTPECSGIVLAPAFYYKAENGNARGIQLFRKNTFSATAKLELDALLMQIEEVPW